MHKTHLAFIAALFSGATFMSAHAAPESKNTHQQQQRQASSEQTAPQQAGIAGTGGTSGGASGRDCPPAMSQGAAERLDPPGPVGRSGSASAMVDDSGTIGSTGATRATTTSGATGTTGEFGSYTQDPSGSVTTSGSTGAPIDPSFECAPDLASGGSGDSAGRGGSTGNGSSAADAPLQNQTQADEPASHSEPHR